MPRVLFSEEEDKACTYLINQQLKKGNYITVRCWDGEMIEGSFQRFVYKGMIVRNKREHYLLRVLDVEKVEKIETKGKK